MLSRCGFASSSHDLATPMTESLGLPVISTLDSNEEGCVRVIGVEREEGCVRVIGVEREEGCVRTILVKCSMEPCLPRLAKMIYMLIYVLMYRHPCVHIRHRCRTSKADAPKKCCFQVGGTA